MCTAPLCTGCARRTGHPPPIADGGAWWWIGAAGARKADSGTDFYSSFEAECRRAGRGTGAVTSTHLLPVRIDLQRLAAEPATLWVTKVRTVVCQLIARSIRDGAMWTARLRNHQISAVVRARDGEAYLTVGAEGYLDPNLISAILNCVPGVDPKSWLPEPDGCLGIEPASGQILYSTMVPADVQVQIVAEFGRDDRAVT